ncbi:MAG: ATP citrate synthase [Deltaproteobacteria bacterium]|nr:ATP citrate synthase [Deltaproteobacteria bacterium]
MAGNLAEASGFSEEDSSATADYQLFTSDTQAIIYNYQTAAIQRMLDFDFACRRKTPSVAAIVYPSRPGIHTCFWGSKEIFIPIYRSIEDAVQRHRSADVFINFASFRSAYQPSREALEQPSIRTVAIVAEGISERRTKELIVVADSRKKWIIGPATVGGIKPGCFKIGNTAGSIENIIQTHLHVPGFVGFVSKSGGMSNEMYNAMALACGPKNADGQFFPALNEGISIGGDRYPGSRLVDHLLRFEANPDIKMLVLLGEVGGEGEYEIAEALRANAITKPLVAWVVGTCSRLFPGEVQFGHAGARADRQKENASEKNKALAKAGAIVPRSYDEFGELIHDVYRELVARGEVKEISVPPPVTVPIDLKVAQQKGLVRKPTSFISTISDDRGEELTYSGCEISRVIEEGYGVGGTIGLLWFKKHLPDYAKRFIDMLLVVVADHGPAVSGAHNAIVAARAGKDLVSAVASGMLTIGPLFGGAIDGAAQSFKDACDRGLSPEEFAKEMKAKEQVIPGIGHRVKSIQNPDKRVELIKQFARANFTSTKYLDYAIEVEKFTTKKKGTLILNVDGAVGVSFIDMLESTGLFDAKEIADIVALGFLNGLFVVGRAIGIVGHVMDQKRLRQTLYRHPWDDITYMFS